jgi:hypothetical protein
MEMAQWRWHIKERTIMAGMTMAGIGHCKVFGITHYGASTIEEHQRLVITSCVKNRRRLNIKSKLLCSNRSRSQPELASDLSILYYMFKWQSWPLLPHPRYWRSLWFWRNLILRNLCSAGLHHQGTRWLGGIAYPRHLVRWRWRVVRRSTLTLSTTSRRLCSVFLCLERITLTLPTTFPLAFSCSGSFFYDTLRSCFLEVLIAHDLCLP